MLLGWAAYGAGVVCLSATLRGLLPVNLYTQYVFQLSAMVEMVMWMAVLGTRNGELRRAAERARSERQRLETLAHTDALTGALNRHALLREGQALVQAAAPGRHVAVCMLDLDDFKAVNDRHGHAVGDRLLQQLAQRLQHLLRGTDQVVRTGGDEFVVVVPGLLSPEEAEAVAAKLLQATAQPFALGDAVCRVGLSVGYALAPDDAADLSTLMARADAAMYAAKSAGKSRSQRAAPGVPAPGPLRA
jgi:diguanylate cyclase (GGDEF)-like protein